MLGTDVQLTCEGRAEHRASMPYRTEMDRHDFARLRLELSTAAIQLED